MRFSRWKGGNPQGTVFGRGLTWCCKWQQICRCYTTVQRNQICNSGFVTSKCPCARVSWTSECERVKLMYVLPLPPILAQYTCLPLSPFPQSIVLLLSPASFLLCLNSLSLSLPAEAHCTIAKTAYSFWLQGIVQQSKSQMHRLGTQTERFTELSVIEENFTEKSSADKENFEGNVTWSCRTSKQDCLPM